MHTTIPKPLKYLETKKNFQLLENSTISLSLAGISIYNHGFNESSSVFPSTSFGFAFFLLNSYICFILSVLN